MEVITGRRYVAESVEIDNKIFVDCKLENCTLVYAGGEFRFVNTSWTQCRFVLHGPANQAAIFLTMIGWRFTPDKSGPADPAEMMTPGNGRVM